MRAQGNVLMKDEIRILVKEPGERWKEETIPNTLEALQEKVDGYIECLTVASNACVICNEEGRITGLPYNCCFMGAEFCGTILLVGTDEDEFTDCPLNNLEVLGV